MLNVILNVRIITHIRSCYINLSSRSRVILRTDVPRDTKRKTKDEDIWKISAVSAGRGKGRGGAGGWDEMRKKENIPHLTVRNILGARESPGEKGSEKKVPLSRGVDAKLMSGINSRCVFINQNRDRVKNPYAGIYTCAFSTLRSWYARGINNEINITMLPQSGASSVINAHPVVRQV